jgi:DNA-binding winged helix-turn-helix (wHTH) protein/tetratricopeptide (TPR) repeat protein
MLDALSSAHRSNRAEGDGLVTYGPFTLDHAAGELRRDGARVSIQPKAFDLLWVLVRSAGRTVTYDELMAAVWPGVHLSEDAVAQMVRRVRRALGDEGSWIESVPKRGYRAQLPPGTAEPPPVDALDAAAELPGPMLLTGSPGVGKTWLLRRLATRFDAHWIDAAHVRDPDVLGEMLLRAAGAVVEDTQGTLTAWARVAHRTGRPWAIDGVDALLPDLEPHLIGLAHSGARVWLTARQHPTSCRVWTVAPLGADEALLLLRTSGARGTPKELAAIAEIVGHNPLLLRLAAMRLTVLSPEELLRRLVDPVQALGAPLEAALRHSWDLLPPEGQAAWHQASLFTETFSASDAATFGISLDHLELLGRWHLLEARQDGLYVPAAIASFGRAQRDRVPDGRDHLRRHAEGVRDEARRRLESYWAARTAETLAAFSNLGNALTTLIGWCDEALPELAYALRVLDGHRMHLCGPDTAALPRVRPVLSDAGPDLAWEACATLRPSEAHTWVRHLDQRFVGTSAGPWVERARAVASAAVAPADLQGARAFLERANAIVDPVARHSGLLYAGRFLATHGALDDAMEVLRRLIAECLSAANATTRASATLYLGNLHKMRGELDVALRLYDEGCLQLARTGASHRALRWRVNQANALALIPDRREEAVAAYQRILAQARAMLDSDAEGLARISLGVTWMTLDRYEEAEAAFRASSGLDGPETFPASRVLFHLASVARRRGDPEAAIAYGQALLARTDAHRQDRAWGAAELQMALADAGRPGSEPVPDDAWGALVLAHRAWAAWRQGEADAHDRAIAELAVAESRAGKAAPATLTHAIAWLRARLS